MPKFDRFDLNELNISDRRLVEIVKDFGYKVDESKYDLKTLYNLVNANLIRNSDTQIKFLRQEKATTQEVANDAAEQKRTNDIIFNSAIALATIRVLTEEAAEIFIRTEREKELDILYSAYMESIQSEKDRAEAARQALMDAQLRDQAARQAVLNDYIRSSEERLNQLKAEAEAIKQRIVALDKLEAQTIKQASVNIAKDLNNLKTKDGKVITGKDGKPIFESCAQEQKEKFAGELLKRIVDHERKAEKELVELDAEFEGLEKEKVVIQNEIKDSKGKSAFSKESANDVVSVAFKGAKSTAHLEEKLASIVSRQTLITEEKQVILDQLKADKIAAVAIAHDAANMHILDELTADERERISSDILEGVEELQSYKAANAQIHEIRDERNLNIEALLNIEAQARKEAEEIKQLKNEVGEDSELEGAERLDELSEEFDDLMADLDSEFGLDIEETEQRASVPARLS